MHSFHKEFLCIHLCLRLKVVKYEVNCIEHLIEIRLNIKEKSLLPQHSSLELPVKPGGQWQV